METATTGRSVHQRHEPYCGRAPIRNVDRRRAGLFKLCLIRYLNGRATVPSKRWFGATYYSAELVLIRLINITGVSHFFEQACRIEIMCLHEILQRIAVISQLRIEQPKQKVRIHGGEIAKIHGSKLTFHCIPSKRRSARVAEII